MKRRRYRFVDGIHCGGLLFTNFVMAISNSRDDGVISSFDAVQATLSLVEIFCHPTQELRGRRGVDVGCLFDAAAAFLKMELPLKFKKQ
jgi:hypothetical protein